MKPTARAIFVAAVAAAAFFGALGTGYYLAAQSAVNDDELRRATAVNCKSILQLRDAAAAIVKRSGEAAAANPRYSEPEKVRLAAFYAENVTQIEVVDCTPHP